MALYYVNAARGSNWWMHTPIIEADTLEDAKAQALEMVGDGRDASVCRTGSDVVYVARRAQCNDSRFDHYDTWVECDDSWLYGFEMEEAN